MDLSEILQILKQSAIKTASTNENFEATLNEALPYLAQAQNNPELIKQASANEDLQDFIKCADAERAKKDFELWQTWKQNPNEKTLSPLLRQFDPVVNNYVKKFKGIDISPNIIRSEAKLNALKAFKSYNPNKSTANLGTWVYANMAKTHRLVARYQNLGQIPENRIMKIGQYLNIKSNLTDQFGREPSHEELADELKWSGGINEIARMEKELRKDLAMSYTDDFGIRDRLVDAGKNRDIITAFYYDPKRTIEEKKFMEYFFGIGGTIPVTNIETISTLTKIPAVKLRTIKDKLAQEIVPYIME